MPDGIQNDGKTESEGSFETDPPGGANPDRSATLKEALAGGTLISLSDLLAASRLRTPLEYAQVRTLFILLMQPDLRDGLFEYLAWLRDHQLPSLRSPSDVLCGFLPLTPDALEAVWMQRITQEAE
jgi:hypothetical protein